MFFENLFLLKGGVDLTDQQTNEKQPFRPSRARLSRGERIREMNSMRAARPAVLSRASIIPPRRARLRRCVSQANGKVLFVDDERMVARMGQRTLSMLGYQVTSLTNSIEALTMFAEDPLRFDVVITDQTMPELSGIELAVKIMEIRPDIPVILTTGFSAEISEVESSAAGVSAYIRKPIEICTLAKIIEKLVERSKKTARN